MWDNRRTKRNPKAPDCRCRDRSCTGVIWRYHGPAEVIPADSPPPDDARGGPEPIGPVVARVLASMETDRLGEIVPPPSATLDDSATRSSQATGGLPDCQADSAAATRALYRRTIRYVGQHVAPLCERFGITVSSDVFAAMVATLFIALHEDAEQLPPRRPPARHRRTAT
jgi:hypothetical protein